MKIRIIYIFLFHLFIISSCFHPDEKKCIKLKQGEFYYKSKKSFEGARIVRNDSVQIVTDEKTGEKIKEKIVWANLVLMCYILYRVIKKTY